MEVTAACEIDNGNWTYLNGVDTDVGQVGIVIPSESENCQLFCWYEQVGMNILGMGS